MPQAEGVNLAFKQAPKAKKVAGKQRQLEL
jgi:hypothetical protein